MRQLWLVLALLTISACGGPAAPALSATTGSAERPTAPRTGPLGDDTAILCVEQYSPAAVAARSFAFDGTVTSVGPGRTNRPDKGALATSAVTFEVHEWWRGGHGSTVTVDLSRGADYGKGTRLLVSGEPRWGGSPLQDAIAWSCGFTRYYDSETAAAWRVASG